MTTATATAERQNHHNQRRVPPPPRPPRLTLAQAVRRHWLLATLPPLLLVGIAVVIAFQRAPTYTAQARLNAGPVGASPQNFSGVAEASQALAGTYARVVSAQAVIEPIGAQLRVSPAQVASRIEASPIPDSSLILLDAHGPSERSAVELANLAGASLIRYVTSLAQQNDDSARLLREFTRTSIKQQELAARQRRLETSATIANRAELRRVEAEVEAVRLELRTLSSLYQTSQQGKASANSIQVLSPAVQAESDRISVLQRLVFVALLAGIAAGVALAVMRSRRRPRRQSETAAADQPPVEADGAPRRFQSTAPTSTSETGPAEPVQKERTARSRRVLVCAALVALIAAAAIAGAYFAFGLPGPLAGGDQRPTSAPPSSAPLHDPPAVPPAEPERQRRQALRLIPKAAAWVCLVDARDRRLMVGNLDPTDPQRVYRSERFRVSLGNPDVELRLNGRRLPVPRRAGPVGYEISAGGLEWLAPAAQPTCGESPQASSTNRAG